MAEAKQEGFGALASVLTRDLNTIEDLPNFVQPPAGVYKLLIKEAKPRVDNKDRQTIAVTYLVIENVSLNDSEGDAEELKNIKMGKDLIGETFYFNDPEKTEETLKYMKKQFGPLGATLGTTNLLEIVEKMANMTVKGTVTRRLDDNDKTRYFASVRNLVAAV